MVEVYYFTKSEVKYDGEFINGSPKDKIRIEHSLIFFINKIN